MKIKNKDINDIEYYAFTYMIPIYKIKPPKDFCEYYQTHKDEIIVDLDKKNKKLNNIINETLDDISFCLTSITQEKISSRDERTRQEMLSCEQILKERLIKLKELKENQ